MIDILTILFLAYIQNISFSVMSRARNRNKMQYHILAACFSNGIWFLTFRELVLSDMSFVLFIPYLAGTVVGSVTGAKISMWIEKLIGASTEEHLKEK